MHLMFFRTFLLSVTILSLVAISLNLAVDPYSTNCWLAIKGFNANKPEAITRQRLVKTFEVYRGKPVAISMGSSRTAIGLEIPSALWEGDPIYNLGVFGAGVDEIQLFLAHAMAQGRLKKAIIGLDFFMFNADYVSDEGLIGFDDSVLSYPGDPNPLRESTSMLSIAMSRDTVGSSLKIFLNNLFGLTKEKYIPPSNPPINQRHEILQEAKKYLDEIYFPKKTGHFTFHNQSRGNMFEHFRQILRFCYQHNIETQLFISPSHAWQWELIHAAGLWPQFEYWKKRIVAIVEEATQYSRPPFPLWDFTGYNSVTTEAVPPCGSHETMTGYLDASHYKPALGRLVLKRVLNQDAKDVPDDFGVLITPSNINNQLEMIRRDRAQWRLNHHSDYDEIRLLATRVFGKANSTYNFICRKIPPK